MKASPSLSSVLVALTAAFVLFLSSASAVNPNAMRSATISSKRNPRGFAMDIDDRAVGCRAHTAEAACAKPCEWCVSAAVPPSCYSSKAAARLPSGVFQCK